MFTSESEKVLRSDIFFAEKDKALRKDVHRLGELVGDLVKDQLGEALFDLVEAVRRAAIDSREGDTSEIDQLDKLLSSLTPNNAGDFIRAFFHLLSSRQHGGKGSPDPKTEGLSQGFRHAPTAGICGYPTEAEGQRGEWGNCRKSTRHAFR